ncbi:RHS repeat domain-containing protein [Streptomyces sp. NPDC001780]
MGYDPHLYWSDGPDSRDDHSLSVTDTSHFDLSVTRTASSRRPDAGEQQTGQVAIFGEEWVPGTAAEATDSDYSHLRRISDTAVAVVDLEGEEISFTANAAKTGWIPEPGSEELTLKGSVSSTFTLSDTEGTVTEFTKPDPAATTWQVSSALMDGLAQTSTTVVSETVNVAGKTLARPRRVIAPTSAVSAATCTATPATKGCRALEFVYASPTTANTSTLGDFTGQVKEIRLWSTDPGAASATSKVVQTYRYDDAGRLTETWKPLISPALKTQYAYDTAGRVTQVTPPGQLPWTFTYGKAGSGNAAGDGTLLKASRPALRQGTLDVVEGTAATSVVYDVPLTGSTAPRTPAQDGRRRRQGMGPVGRPDRRDRRVPRRRRPGVERGQRPDHHVLQARGRHVHGCLGPRGERRDARRAHHDDRVRPLRQEHGLGVLAGTPRDQPRYGSPWRIPSFNWIGWQSGWHR